MRKIFVLLLAGLISIVSISVAAAGGCCDFPPGYSTPCRTDLTQVQCEITFNGIWHEDWDCCPMSGWPNENKCFSPGPIESGCCEWSAGCGSSDTYDVGFCTDCMGGTWYPGWECEEGECVPEASTLVLLATGLLFLVGYLGLRRKEN